MSAHHNLIEYMLRHDLIMSVWSEGDCLQEQTQDKALLIDALESVEMAQLNIYLHPQGDKPECLAYAVIIPFGVGPEETVANWAPATGIIEEWHNHYCERGES